MHFKWAAIHVSVAPARRRAKCILAPVRRYDGRHDATGFAMINSAICDFSFCSITENTAFNPACSTAYGIAVIFVISSLSAHRYPRTRYAYLYLHLTFYSFVFCLGETNECSGRVGDDKKKFFFFSYLVHDFAKMG